MQLEAAAAGLNRVALHTCSPLTHATCCTAAQVVLVYTEALVVTQFAFMVPRRLHCDFLSPQLQHA